MADLGEIGRTLGRGLMFSAGPSGRTAAASMLNTERRLASAKIEADLDRDAANKQAELDRIFNVVEGIEDTLGKTNDPNDRAALMDVYTGLKARYPEVGQAYDERVLQAIKPSSESAKDFTLSPGQTRFSATGEEIASIPKASEQQKRGRLVKASELHPEAPDDLFMIEGPGGGLTVLKGQKGEGGKVELLERETEDGFTAVYKRVNDGPWEFQDYLRDEAGKKMKSGVAGRAENRADRASRTEQRLSRSEKIRVENDNATRRKADLKANSEMERNLDVLDSLLTTAEDGTVNAPAIRNTLSQVFNTNVRALAELQSFASFGSVVDRIARNISMFMSGTLNPESIKQIQDISRQMRQEVAEPFKAEVNEFYRQRTIDQGGDPKNVIREARKEAGSIDPDLERKIAEGKGTPEEVAEYMRQVNQQ